MHLNRQLFMEVLRKSKKERNVTSHAQLFDTQDEPHACYFCDKLKKARKMAAVSEDLVFPCLLFLLQILSSPVANYDQFTLQQLLALGQTLTPCKLVTTFFIFWQYFSWGLFPLAIFLGVLNYCFCYLKLFEVFSSEDSGLINVGSLARF